MFKMMLIGAAACTVATADESYSTFGHDWDFTSSIPYIGQTMIVPDECTMLESFEFLATAPDAGVPYLLTVFKWSEETQQADGPALFIDPGQVNPGEDPLHAHEVGVELPAGEKIAVVVAFYPDPGDDYAAGYTLEDTHAPGSLIGTYDPGEGEWLFQEGDEYDLVFAAQWTICAVDMYDDDVLNIFDFLAFQAAFQAGDMAADFNADGILNVLDFVAFQAAFIDGC